MGEPKTYKGSCHCGKVKYEATVDLTAPVLSCNCSICQRAGWLLSFVPATQFNLISGEDALTDYLFNKKHIHHLFCSTCGVKPFGRGKGPNGVDMVAVNVRCLEGVEPSTLTLKNVDGRSA